MTEKTISHYVILEKLGEGGMSKVYLAEDTKLERKAALKFLDVSLTADREARLRFTREAKAAASLNHPNIVTIYEINEFEDQTYIAMEYIEGETLDNKLWSSAEPLSADASGTVKLKRMTIESIIAMAIQVCEGLEAAHQAGIVHRDVKPQNIIIASNGRVKILDFGLAKLVGGSSITQEICRIGTFRYMSPEQAQAETLDHRTDIWALGVVLYEMVTGQLPFNGNNPHVILQAIIHESPLPPTTLRATLPPALETIIFKCLRKDPGQRYPTMKSLSSDLKKLAKSLKDAKTGITPIPQDISISGKDTERRQATIMAAEISGYDEMLEEWGAEETAAVMDSCFKWINALVEKYGGKINKIMQNCLTIIFGLPTAIEDAPKEAVNTAIEIRSRLYRWNRENNLDISLDIRIGINTGMVIAGIMSTAGKTEYTIMGDTVTRASQLMDLAGKGDIYIGPLTHRYTRNEFDYKELKPLFPKGKTTPVDVFELLSTTVKPHRPGLDLEQMIDSEMVGREKELDKLKLHVLKVLHGEGSVVNVISEAGIGKSRLIAELKKNKDLKKVTLLEGRALAIGKNLSYHPIIESLKNWAGIKEGDSETESFAKLEQAIAQVYPGGTPEVFPFVATMMGMKVRGSHAVRVKGIEGEAMEKLILKNLRELLVKCAAQRPLIYINEDLHWADISSIELLESLFRLAEIHPILFINVLRPNHQETGERLLQTIRDRYGKISTDIYLEPLEEKECETLIRNLVKAGGLPAVIGTTIIKRSEGNPFFIEELVRSFFDEGVLELSGGNLRIPAQIDTVTIPETIQDVLMARIDLLEDTTRTLLKEAAVIGRYFFFKILAAVTETSGAIKEKLDYLKKIQLISERKRLDEIEYLFKHALAQEAAYESILFKKRKELHLKAAHAIETVFPERLHEFFGMLALHYSKGENLEKAEEYLIKAGEEALKAAASSEALSYYREALALYLRKTAEAVNPEKIAMLEKNIGIALFNKGYYVEALDHFDRVFALWGKRAPQNKFIMAVNLAVNLVKLLKNLYFPGKKPKKIPGKRDSEIINLAEKKAEALTAINAVRFFLESMGNLTTLIKFDISKIENGVSIFTACSALFSYTGLSFGISRKILDYIKKYIDKKDSKCSLVYNHIELVHNFYAGTWPKELEYDEELIDQGLYVGEFFYTLAFTLISGLLRIEQGNFRQAAGLVTKFGEIGETYRRELVTGRKYTLNAKLLLKSRRLNEGLKEAEEGIALLTRIGQKVYCLAVIGMKANMQILLKDSAGAENSLLQGKALIAQEISVAPSYRSALLISQFLVDLVRLEEAFAAADKVKIKQFRKKASYSGKAAVKNTLKFAADQTEAFKLRGVYYWLTGRQKKALLWWQKSIIVGEHLGARLELARTYMEIGKRLLEKKSKFKQWNKLQPREYLEKARELFSQMRLEWDLQELAKICR